MKIIIRNIIRNIILDLSGKLTFKYIGKIETNISRKANR